MTWSAALALLAASALPQPPSQPLSPADSARGARLGVYLLTFDSGAAAWERFGHNALWIHDPNEGTDAAYDYGRFSFRERNFLLRFALGRLRYWMGDGDVRSYLAFYQREGRQIWSQELRLSARAKLDLKRFLEWNIQEEHKYYDYDYYRDNCSTRIRDAIDRATGGALRRYGDSVRTSLTYRDHTRRLTQNNPFLYAVLMIGLGQPVDRPISAWEAMFLPIELRPYLNRLMVTASDGQPRSLVVEERLLAPSDRFPVPNRPSRWLPWFLMTGLGLGLILVLTGRRAIGAVRSSWTSRVFRSLATVWTLVAGLGGALLGFLWGFTDHRFSVANENLLQFNLLSLGLALVLPAALRGGRARLLGLWLAGAAVATSLLGLALKLVPDFQQANLDVIGLALPIHLGLFVGLRGSLRRGEAGVTAG